MTTISGNSSVTVDRVSGTINVVSELPGALIAVAGPQGTPGEPGPPLNILGTLASETALPTASAVGDAYLTEDDNHLRVYGSNGWVDLGVMGGESQTYTHTQAVASTTWTVTHNLGRHPAIHVEDSVGNVVHGSIQHVSNNEAVVSFTSVATGTAICS